jgi:hypothetical protein
MQGSVLRVAWGAAGLLLLGAQLWLLALSPRFAYGSTALERPVVQLVALGVAAGGIYLALPWVIRATARPVRALPIWIFAIGLLMRLAMLPSTPILEDDFHRYLWDGAVVSRGLNPYTHAPSDATSGNAPADLVGLAGEAGSIAERINHPQLRTIYPPVTQAAFALAHRLEPWSLTAWRTTLLASDLLTVALLAALLRALDRSPLWAALYWWNPLVVKELFNSAHTEALLLPFLLGALLLAIRARPVLAAASLALATGVKLWPVLLLPALLKFAPADRRRLRSAGVFVLLVALLALPILQAGLDQSAGFVAYARAWELNDALFRLITWLAHHALVLLGGPEYQANSLARILVAALLVFLSLRLNRESAADGAELCRRSLVVVAVLFLVLPTQFPWYYVWLVPFLAVFPCYSLLLLTALLPLYYLRYYLDARGQVEWFDYGIVWIEYAPVWLLLAYEWRSGRARRQPAASEAAFP